MDSTKLKERYGASEHGNFAVIDTIGVPHPYCITAQHVSHASDFCGGRLDQDAITAAERAGAKCGICHGKLKYKEHETALLVSCRVDMVVDGERPDDIKVASPELHAYLLKVKPLCEEDKYVGFAFKDDVPKDAAT